MEISNITSLSKEELKVYNENYIKGLKERKIKLEQNFKGLQSNKEFILYLQTLDCNTMHNGKPIYPLHNVAHNLSVLCPEVTPLFIEPCLEVITYIINKYIDSKKSWKSRFFKRDQELFKYNKLKDHLAELDKAHKDGVEIVKPFGDTIMYLQDLAPEKSKYLIDSMLNICNSAIDFTYTSIQNYNNLKL